MRSDRSQESLGLTDPPGDVAIKAKPFPHFIAPTVFNHEASLIVLDWFESGAPWRLVKADFYEQYEFDVENVDLPNNLSFLADRSTLDPFVKRFEVLFDAALAQRVDVTAHKLVPGQTIKLHNDFVPGQESHRYLIQLNRGWRDEHGGFLIYFNSEDPADVHSIIRPVHNSGSGFEISEKSNHAVSTVHGGERYTLVYSFYAAPGWK